MQGNSSALHTFIRIDRSGKPIDSTNKSLKSAPRQGRWLKVDSITGNVCCDYVTLSAIPVNDDTTGAVVTIFCNGVKQQEVFVIGTFDGLDEMVVVLNTNASILGTFSTDGTSIFLKTPRSTVNCDGTLTMTIGDIDILTDAPGTVSGTGWAFSLACDATDIFSIVIDETTTTIQDVADMLNARLNWLGVFTVDGTDIVLTLPTALATSICSGTLTMAIALD